MPTYAYACKDCDHTFDIQQSFSDDSLSVCPACSGSLRKKFNSVGVVFKGSGFYRNDSRDTKKSVETGATKAAPASGGEGSSTTEPSSGSAAPSPTTAASTKAAVPAAAG